MIPLNFTRRPAAETISQTERRTMAAERETTERLIARYLSDHVGAEFSARISGLAPSGLFVRLSDTGADGYVPASSLDDDYPPLPHRQRGT